MCNKNADNKFSILGRPRKIWAVSAIHSDVERLTQIHDAIFSHIAPGDRLIYLGNYTGYGAQAVETIDELLIFRRLLLAQPAMTPDDIIYLRGQQEDMLQRLLLLQFEQYPVDTLLGMMGHGLSATMQSYGLSPHDGVVAAREGIYSLNKWTNTIRQEIRAHAGHDYFMTQTRRAAFTQFAERTPVLFVNAGLDASRSLEEQENIFWNNQNQFDAETQQYERFEKVIRGFDPAHKGVHLNGITATLDGGCGFGGSLVCANMSAEGEIYQLMEA